MHVSGSSVPEYEHMLPEILGPTSAENAVITVLLLRGIQAAGEITQATDRLHTFSTVKQVEEILQGSSEYPNGPLVRAPSRRRPPCQNRGSDSEHVSTKNGDP